MPRIVYSHAYDGPYSGKEFLIVRAADPRVNLPAPVGLLSVDLGSRWGVKVEKKVGARFVKQRVFDDEREAERWAREQQKAEPGSRWRLSLGG